MRRLTDSVTLALINLLLAGLAWVGIYLNHKDTAIVIGMVFVPILLLLTLVFLIRDLIKPATRLHGLLALILSVPSAVLLSFMRIR
jgi:hypothetical protein